VCPPASSPAGGIQTATVSHTDAPPGCTWPDRQGQHVVQYEEGVRLAATLAAVLRLGVASLAFWRLGQDAPAQWDVSAQAVQRWH
jgi:spore germination protein YaaH